MDLDLEPSDFAELDLDLEPSDLAEEPTVFLPEDRDELGLESFFDFPDEFADEALDPTLVTTLLLSGDRSRDDNLSAASLDVISDPLDSAELVEILSSSALADETRMESLSDLSPGVSFELI